MKRDIKSIILLLATQCMINLGEIEDPITKKRDIKLEKAEVFIDLLDELELKTKGNLSDEENGFIKEVVDNLKKVYKKKSNIGF
jgi:hypothetical protein